MSPPQTTETPRRGTLVGINGYALRELRKLAGITTAQLVTEVSNADGKGFDRTYLSRIENGQRRHLSPALFARIVRALHVDRRALLADPPKAKPTKAKPTTSAA